MPSACTAVSSLIAGVVAWVTGDARKRQEQTGPQDLAADSAFAGSQSHAHADFPGALLHREGHHAVHAETGQQEREQARTDVIAAATRCGRMPIDV